jgi:hypothetical protein
MISSIARMLAGPVKSRWEAFRYTLGVKRSGLPLYLTNDTERICAEVAFVDAFRQLQARYPWLGHPVFPLGGAANHALLVVLSRILIEQNPATVIEFGAGQTTHILSKWSEVSGARVITVEQDAHWVGEVRRHVKSASHEIVQAPLRKSRYGDLWYDMDVLRDALIGAQADLMVVDGPTGSAEWSRAGFIDCFGEIHQPDWMILWDDLHRRPDFQSFDQFVASVRASDVNCRMAFSQTSKTLGIACTEKFQTITYYV